MCEMTSKHVGISNKALKIMNPLLPDGPIFAEAQSADVLE